jgi:ribokinase
MIIVFGSNVLDQFFHLGRFPEKDQAVHVDTHIEAPGGKGQNQAVAAAKAGASVRFFGAVGDGGHGRFLIKNLQNLGINTSGVQIVPDMPTSVAAIFVDDTDGTHRVVVSQGANKRAVQSDIPDDLLQADTTLLLQAELDLAQTAELIRRARARACRSVILNLAPYHALSADILSNIDILVMNEHEAASLRAHLGIADAGFEDFARRLHGLYGVTPLVTLGPDGAIAYDGQVMYRVNSLSIKAVDTIGAGDAFCGFLAAAIDEGKSLPEAMRVASVAGAMACTKVGAQEAIPDMAGVVALVGEVFVHDQKAA